MSKIYRFFRTCVQRISRTWMQRVWRRLLIILLSTAQYTETTDRCIQMTEPCTEMTEPCTEMTEPCTQMTEPCTEMTEPCTEMTEPCTEMNEPCTQMTEPCTQMNNRYTQKWTDRLVLATSITNQHYSIVFLGFQSRCLMTICAKRFVYVARPRQLSLMNLSSDKD